MRGLSAVLALILLPAAGLPPVWAQAEAVEFRLTANRGDVIQYATTASVEVTLEILQARVRQEARLEAREVHRVLDVQPDGTIQVELVLEDLKTTTDGRTEESLDEPWVLRVGPDGRILSPAPGRPADYPFPLPGRRVAVGDSWNRQSQFNEEGVIAQVTTTLTLAGIEQSGGGQVAKIRTQANGRVTGAPAIPLPPGAQSQTGGMMRGAGEIEWSIEQGRILRSTVDSTFDVTYDVTVQDQTSRVRLTMRITTQLQHLGAGAPAPAVAPEFLIVGGKAIGALTLDLAAGDVTSRLGQPTSTQPPEGQQAGRLFWREPPLVLYVDPSDTNKIIGIAIGDRRYRTDKGVGFGSSMGAVLLGYGPPQSTAEVNIPNLGGMRYLIYNDLGIVFGITADQEHAARGPSHAPVGAVDTVIVFPPGEAAKVVSVP